MKKVVDQFEKRAESYSASANWIADNSLIRAHIEAAESKRGGSVLEVCCGTGMVGRNFRAEGWQINGIDLTRGMAEEANRYYPCICTPAENIPFLDGSFDVVVLRQAYFLLDDGQKVLAEVSRVLKQDGIFILSQTVPFSAEDRPWLEHIHRTKQFQLKEFFTAGTLADELEKQYFSIVATRNLTVRENISRWMAAAPELTAEKQAEVCSLIANAPEPYRSIHRVETVNGELLEDWNWTIFTARKK
jgi:ubiquinone/menaquinone biosynthesis C-methylase UbiE